MTLYNLARMTTTSTGTGSIVLSVAVSGFLTFDEAGVQNGDTVSYSIQTPTDSEVGTGVYTTATKTLTRNVTNSTNSDAALVLDGVNQEVAITVLAADITDVTIGTANGLSLVGQALSMAAAASGTTGALTGTDWDTFNGKQDALGFTPVNIDGDTMTGPLIINVNSTAALLVEQDGVKDNVFVVDTTNGAVGFGTSSPQSQLHIIQDGAIPGLSYVAGDALIIEKNGNVQMSIYSPDASSASINFGSPSDSNSAVCRWDFSSKEMRIGTAVAGGYATIHTGNGTQMMKIVSNSISIGNAFSSAAGLVHIKGSQDDEQLIIQANSTQTNKRIMEIWDSSGNILRAFDQSAYDILIANAVTDTAPNDDTTLKKMTLQKLAAPPTNAAYIAFSNNPGTDTFYLVLEEG